MGKAAGALLASAHQDPANAPSAQAGTSATKQRKRSAFANFWNDSSSGNLSRAGESPFGSVMAARRSPRR